MAINKTFGNGRRMSKMHRAVRHIVRKYSQNLLLRDKIFSYIGPDVELQKLPFGSKDLEPHLSESLLTNHYQIYTRDHEMYKKTLEYYDGEAVPQKFRAISLELGHYGGSVINHDLFWKNLCSAKQQSMPTEPLFSAIKRDFGSTESLCRNLKTAGLNLIGPGWIWLAYSRNTGKLSVVTTSVENICRMVHGLIPLIGIDMWEHAYYLQYQNRKAEYLDNIMNLLCWKQANERLMLELSISRRDSSTQNSSQPKH